MPILTLDEIVEKTNDLKKLGKIIVTTNGVFDVLHIGHLKCLEQAKKYGDILIVGINSDESVKMLNKGPGRPFNNEQDRAVLINGLGCVDYVFLFNDLRPTASLAKIKPHFHVKSRQYENFCPEAEVIKEYGGEVIFLDILSDYSTTDLVIKIIKAHQASV